MDEKRLTDSVEVEGLGPAAGLIRGPRASGVARPCGLVLVRVEEGLDERFLVTARADVALDEPEVQRGLRGAQLVARLSGVLPE